LQGLLDGRFRCCVRHSLKFGRTASGIQTSLNWECRSSRRPIIARLETGEVSLTATISKVFGKFFRSVVSRDAPLGYQISELVTRYSGQLHSFAKGQNSLRVKGKGKLASQAFLRLTSGRRRLRATESGT